MAPRKTKTTNSNSASRDHKSSRDYKSSRANRPSHGAGTGGSGTFHIEFKNEAQSLAWAAFKQHDVLFLIGPAGCGKSFLACAFAIEQLINKERKRIILTRPIVESGESLGFLPGEFEEKVEPYMMPMYDCIDKLVGRDGAWRDKVDTAVEVAPIAYMRGRTFDDAVCIFDEAQNASLLQLKLFLTRFGENSKIVITGDPSQSDIAGKVALVEVMQKLRGTDGVGVVEFKSNSIVRHPLVGKIIEKLEV
jgi:phosphate starvation-inducible protein PhoH and related proteins